MGIISIPIFTETEKQRDGPVLASREHGTEDQTGRVSEPLVVTGPYGNEGSRLKAPL